MLGIPTYIGSLSRTLTNVDARRSAKDTILTDPRFAGHAEHAKNPMAALLYNIALEGFEDESIGNANWWQVRLGRWLIEGDEDGFLNAIRFKSAQQASDYITENGEEMEAE